MNSPDPAQSAEPQEQPASGWRKYNLLDLRFQAAIGLGASDADFQVTVVQRTNLDTDGQSVLMVPSLTEPGHTQQHRLSRFSGAAGRNRTIMSPNPA